MEREKDVVNTYIYTMEPITKKEQVQNPYTYVTLKIWRKYMRLFALLISPLCPILDYLKFKSREKYVQFKNWKRIGIYRIGDLFDTRRQITIRQRTKQRNKN